MKLITIGITDCSKYENYSRWFEKEPEVVIVRLSHHENNLADIAKCDAIVLTGGEDVHPRFYNNTDYEDMCHEIDESRDEFELKVLEYTEKNQLPVLGICRGLQVANVFFGGTLLPHIPAFGKFDHSKSGADDRYHTVQVDPNSQLKAVVNTALGEVNSAHHQSADRVGRGLVANALSPDGVVEGLERENMKDENFLMLVQWHPERMKDLENAFSKNIKKKFISVVRSLVR
jgi:putative glutamine amidotransferase